MLAMIRYYGTGIVLSIALAGIAVVCPKWPEVFGLEIASQQHTTGYVVLEPGHATAVRMARIEAKIQIVSRLHAGELDLFEATGCFADINREPAAYADRSWEFLPGSSNEEKQCRQVIRWSRSNFSHSMPASELDLFVEKLEAQLSERLSDRGRIELSPCQ